MYPPSKLRHLLLPVKHNQDAHKAKIITKNLIHRQAVPWQIVELLQMQLALLLSLKLKSQLREQAYQLNNILQ